MVGGSRLGFNRKRKKRLCAFEELAWLVFLLLLAFLLALSQHLSVEVLAEKTYISSLVEVHIVTMQTNIYIAYSRKSRKWCLQNFVELFFLFFYFAILYERNLSKIRWIRTWKCRFLFKFEVRLANFNLYGLSGVISFQKTFRLGVYISGGTLLWNNRRLIGRSLIVLARKVQNNRD